MLVHVTGVAGSGKSTLQRELTARGYLAEDGDDGFCGWLDTSGNQVPNRPISERTPDWYRTHVWMFLPDKVEQLAATCVGRVGFLLGIVGDLSPTREHFSGGFYLTAPTEVITARLSARDGQGYDTRFAVFGSAAKWQQAAERYWAGEGFVPIDAARPPTDVADELLALVVP